MAVPATTRGREEEKDRGGGTRTGVSKVVREAQFHPALYGPSQATTKAWKVALPPILLTIFLSRKRRSGVAAVEKLARDSK